MHSYYGAQLKHWTTLPLLYNAFTNCQYGAQHIHGYAVVATSKVMGLRNVVSLPLRNNHSPVRHAGLLLPRFVPCQVLTSTGALQYTYCNYLCM